MDSAYDRALLEVGTGGSFQKQTELLYNVVFSGLWSMVSLHMVLAVTILPHTCKLPPKAQNVTEEAWKLKHIPYENAYGKIKFDECRIYISRDDNNLTRSCDEYEYNTTWFGSTVSSEKNWVCDKEIYIPNILAYSRIAELSGTMFFGWTGDVYGRRPTYIVTLGLTLIGRVISLLSGQSYIIFLVGCLINSLGISSVMQSVSVIVVELTSSERRSAVTSIRLGATCIGGIVMAVSYWWIKDWKIFIIVTTVPLVPFLLLSWHMVESPLWQYSNGKTQECVKQLKFIAKKNHQRLNSKTENDILSHVPKKDIKSLGPFAFFSSRTLAVNTLLQLVMWTVGCMCYTLQVLYTNQNSDGNPFVEICWQILSEIPANFISAWLANSLGRRYTGAMAFGTMAIAWALMAFRRTSTYSWTNFLWIGTILNVIIRFSSATSYYISFLFAMELYPTSIRQTGMSLCNVCSNIGSVITPYIFYMGRPIDERLPGLVITGLALFSMCCSLLLPETLNKKLPETIEEAQSFGRRKQKYSSVPLELDEKPQEKN